MKKMFIIAIMVAASAGWSTIGLHGQASEAGPSLDETVTYMKSFLDQHGCTTIEGATGYSKMCIRDRSQTGGPGLTLPVDSAENAQHLINALSHAITLCGGKKAAF